MRHGLSGSVEATRHIDDDPGDSTTITIREAGNGQHSVVLVTVHDGGHRAKRPVGPVEKRVLKLIPDLWAAKTPSG